MTDLVFVLIVVAFFAVCVAFVRACDGIIGPDSETSQSSAEPQAGDVAEVTP